MKKIILFVSMILMNSVTSYASDQNDNNIDNSKLSACDIFPDRNKPYELSEIKQHFKSVLDKEAYKIFEKSIEFIQNKPEVSPYDPLTHPKGLRCLYMNAQLAPEGGNSSTVQEGAIFQFLAAPKLPYKQDTYSFEGLKDIFYPVLKEEAKAIFTEGFNILLNPEYGTPKHTGKGLVDAYRCLYGKCVYALTTDNPNQFQKEALLKLFAFRTHKGLIKKNNQELGSKITDSPCEFCLAQAREELPKVQFDLFARSDEK